MTRREPIQRREIAGFVAVLLGALATAAMLGWLRTGAPAAPADLDLGVEGVQSERGEDQPFVTCQRTLPDRPPRVISGQQTPEPVGLVRSSEVVACPDTFDPSGDGGPTVEFVGEVVGDVLRRDGGAWVLMNDDVYALEAGPLPGGGELAGSNSGLTVWLPESTVDLSALTPGRPDRRGDVVAVTGNVFRADPADGGGLTLRAAEAEVVAQAVRLAQPLHTRQAVVAALLAVLALALTAYERLLRARY